MAAVGAQIPSGLYSRASGLIDLKCCHTGGNPPTLNTDGTDTTPVITEAYLAEVVVHTPGLCTGFANFNGSVASGNLIAFLADALGNQLAVTGVIAMSGTDSFQKLPWTVPQALQSGNYFVGIMTSNTTARLNFHTFGFFNQGKLTALTTMVPPATFTPPTTFTTALGPMGTLY